MTKHTLTVVGLHLKTETKSSSSGANPPVQVSVAHGETRISVDNIIVIVAQLLVSPSS